MLYLVIFVGIAILIYAYFDNIPRPTTTDIAKDLVNIVIVIIAGLIIGVILNI